MSKLLVLLMFVAASLNLKADIQLPIGAAINGCPFFHDDAYDVGYLIEAF